MRTVVSGANGNAFVIQQGRHVMRVRAVEQARHLANLGQMSAILAHEIRNPLASLKGNAQLIRMNASTGARSQLSSRPGINMAGR